MIIGIALSKNKTKIHLTDERWLHISIAHPEVAMLGDWTILGVIEDPDYIFSGSSGELLAARKENSNYSVVVYKEETSKIGFVITAYRTTALKWMLRKKIIWKKFR